MVTQLEGVLDLAPEIQVEVTPHQAEEHPQERNMALFTGLINPEVAVVTALVEGWFILKREVM